MQEDQQGSARPMTLEQFRRGKIPSIDHGMLAFPHGCSKAQARRNQKIYEEYTIARDTAMRETRQEYERLLAAGVFRLPTAYEGLYEKCGGHPDNQSVQACRRLLKKKFGVDYNDIRQ